MTEALAYFRGGIDDYLVNLGQRVSVIRGLRQGVEYHFSRADIDSLGIGVNDRVLDLRRLPRSRQQQAFSAAQLQQEYQRSPAPEGCPGKAK